MTTVAERQMLQAIDSKEEAIQHLKQGIDEGKHWFIALLEAMALWPSSEEVRDDRHYYYLVGGEAFDWLVLAQRLLEEIEGQVPEAEVNELLFEGKLPLELGRGEFRILLGHKKYQAYLNYFYGVMVEESLILAVVGEVRKKWWCWGYNESHENVLDEVFYSLYASSQKDLWERFCEEKGFRRQRQISLHQLKEFTYWLFKRRMTLWDKARIASDTKKGIDNLKRQRRGRVE